MLEPDAAPKPAQAQLVATARPPGNPPNHARAARNNPDAMPALLAIDPINRNIGIADKSQLAAKENGVSRMTASAILILPMYQKPQKATAPIATPMGTRMPINSNITARLPNATTGVLITLLPRSTAAWD